MVRFPKFFQLYISKLNFLSFKENNYKVQTGFQQVLGYFCIFLHIFCICGPISKFFSVIHIKLKFPCCLEKTTMTVRLLFCRFLAIFKFFHIFDVYSPIFLFFKVKDLKIKFPVVLRKHAWRSDCFLAGFCYFYMFYIFPHIFGVFGTI